MSTELQVNSLLDGCVTLTQFHGGEQRGVCVQVTQSFGSGNHFVQLTAEQAFALAVELRAWSMFQLGREGQVQS